MADKNSGNSKLTQKSLLKLHNVRILTALFSKTAPRILMKLCMQLGYVCVKVLVIVAGLVIAPFKRKAAGGRLNLASYNKRQVIIATSCHCNSKLNTNLLVFRKCNSTQNFKVRGKAAAMTKSLTPKANVICHFRNEIQGKFIVRVGNSLTS